MFIKLCQLHHNLMLGINFNEGNFKKGHIVQGSIYLYNSFIRSIEAMLFLD